MQYCWIGDCCTSHAVLYPPVSSKELTKRDEHSPQTNQEECRIFYYLYNVVMLLSMSFIYSNYSNILKSVMKFILLFLQLNRIRLHEVSAFIAQAKSCEWPHSVW